MDSMAFDRGRASVKVLVTGGAGFIGSNLVRCLAASGESVRVLDDLSSGTLGNLEGVSGLVDVMVAPLADVEAVRRTVDGAEIIYHLAGPRDAHRSPRASEDERQELPGVLNLLKAASAGSVRRFVYASSASVYGGSPRLPTREDAPVIASDGAAASKLTCEDYCRAFSRLYGLQSIGLRFFEVFGPREAPSGSTSTVTRFLSAMLRGRPPVIFGGGAQVHDFVYVANAVQALVLATACPDGAYGEVVNIGSGKGMSLLQLINEINTLLGTSIAPIFGIPHEEDLTSSQADIAGARRLLHYEPLVSFERGLAESASWLVGSMSARPEAKEHLIAI